MSRNRDSGRPELSPDRCQPDEHQPVRQPDARRLSCSGRESSWSWIVLLSLGSAISLAVTVLVSRPLLAQSCTTQAKMTPEVRNGLADAALALAAAVQANDVAKVQARTISEFAGNFGVTADLIRRTAGQLQGDALRVTQLYELDATARKTGDTTVADFICALTGTTSETDFAIPALPPGTYGFAMVEASGANPWLLSFLLRQESGQWKMAGFYPRTRTAAGHDGLWYWRAARDAAKDKQLWLAWLLYDEAGQLLAPASFVSSTNLDLLETERRTAVPPELSGGIGLETPLVIPAVNGSNATGGVTEFRFTGMAAQVSDDGKSLNLMLHLLLSAGADPAAPDPAAAKARNTAAAEVLLDAHKQLRQDFQNVWVFAESPGHAPFATEQKIADIP